MVGVSSLQLQFGRDFLRKHLVYRFNHVLRGYLVTTQLDTHRKVQIISSGSLSNLAQRVG